MSGNIQSDSQVHGGISRRDILRMAAGAGAAGAAAMSLSSCAIFDKGTEKAVTKGRINQSIVHWCFAEYWDINGKAYPRTDLAKRSMFLEIASKATRRNLTDFFAAYGLETTDAAKSAVKNYPKFRPKIKVPLK